MIVFYQLNGTYNFTKFRIGLRMGPADLSNNEATHIENEGREKAGGSALKVNQSHA